MIHCNPFYRPFWAVVIVYLFFIPLLLWSFPENYPSRKALEDLFTDPPQGASREASRIFPQEGEFPAVRFVVEKQRDSFYLLFLNERDLKFPQFGAGSYIIRRNLESGKIEQIKIFLKDDPDSFLRLFPDGSRSRLDLYLYGEQIYKSVPLPFPLLEFVAEPFSRIMDLTRDMIRWDLIFPREVSYKWELIKNLGEGYRNLLPNFLDADDGAMESDGTYVRISDGIPLVSPGVNCSGYVKWITDSLYKTKTGRYLSLEELSQRHIDLRGNRWSNQLEWQRDPYFGLDWIRNAAVALLSLEGEAVGPEDGDVRNLPFFSYREDIGFPVERLSLLLYLLALENPGFFYFGSVNGPFGEDLVLRQHYHVAAFFPYLDEEGNLQVIILERARSTPLKEFQRYYKTEYLHLVKIEGFIPSEYPPFPGEKLNN